MANNQLFRFAGWCAALAVVLSVLAFVPFAAATSGSTLVISTLTLLVLTVVFYALYVVHRAESAGLSLAGLVLWVLAGAVNFFSLLSQNDESLYKAANLLFALPLLVFGLLAYRSSKMPRGVALLALVGGVAWAIAGFIPFGMALSYLTTVIWLAWLVWLWRVFSSRKLASA